MRTGRLRRWLVLLAAAVGGSAVAGEPGSPAGPVRGMDDLVRMGRGELEDLYRNAPPAPVPHGFTPGRAIFSPGSPGTGRKARTTRLLWQGKVFRDDGTMVNRVFGVFRAVRARVYEGESWLDGRPSLVMDYCGTSKLFGDVRDEVREVAPGLYLGLTYLRKPTGPELAMFFALDARR